MESLQTLQWLNLSCWVLSAVYYCNQFIIHIPVSYKRSYQYTTIKYALTRFSFFCIWLKNCCVLPENLKWNWLKKYQVHTLSLVNITIVLQFCWMYVRIFCSVWKTDELDNDGRFNTTLLLPLNSRVKYRDRCLMVYVALANVLFNLTLGRTTWTQRLWISVKLH